MLRLLPVKNTSVPKVYFFYAYNYPFGNFPDASSLTQLVEYEVVKVSSFPPSQTIHTIYVIEYHGPLFPKGASEKLGE